MTSAPELVIVGGVVADRTPEGLVPGGAAFYATRAALALGARVGVLTHQRDDLDVAAALDGAAVAFSGSSTLTFTNTYGPQRRVQIVEGSAAALSHDDLPGAWRTAPAALFGPVYHEVSVTAAEWFSTALVGVAPQGWMRRADADGIVHPVLWSPPSDLVRRADLVSLSEEDLGRDAAAERQLAARCRLLVVTRGARGCTVFRCGAPTDVPGVPVEERDPTGAGDVFAAALLVRLAGGDDFIDAISFANAAASFSVEAHGVAGLPTLTHVLARMDALRRGDHYDRGRPAG